MTDDDHGYSHVVQMFWGASSGEEFARAKDAAARLPLAQQFALLGVSIASGRRVGVYLGERRGRERFAILSSSRRRRRRGPAPPARA